MKDEALENSVVTLFVRGASVRSIARSLRIGRNRVKRILTEHDQLREQGNEPLPRRNSRSSKLAPYQEYIHELLEKFTRPAPTCQRIFELITEKGYGGGITILKDYLATLRPKKKKEVIHTVETAPGQRGQHDWSEYTIKFTQPARILKVIFFSFILSFSRRQYMEVVENKSQPTLFRALVNAFKYFGGVPHQIKGDNQKGCVARWEAGHPIFNAQYLEFATYYQFQPLTIRPGRPQENLKVERPFYYLETNFLNARTFRDPQDLKQQLAEWLNKSDLRIHRTTKRPPLDLFAEESAYLQPLPNKPYDLSTIVYRIVNGEACVQWNGYFYAVPEPYLFECCPVRITQEELLVYSPDCELLVIHQLAPPNSETRYVGRPLRLTRRTPQLDAATVTERLQRLGPPMAVFITEIKKHQPKNYRDHLRHILTLKLYYEVKDILLAVERATQYRVFDSRAIENFLTSNAQKRNEIELLPQKKGKGQK